MTDRALRVGALVAAVLGVALMIPFDHPVTLALGVVCLFAFIVLGLFGLLTPERLSREPAEVEGGRTRPAGREEGPGRPRQ